MTYLYLKNTPALFKLFATLNGLALPKKIKVHILSKVKSDKFFSFYVMIVDFIGMT
jgi:hypothetical protein